LKYIFFILFLWPFLGNGQIITTVAGNGVSGYNGDTILATSAKLNNPYGVISDNSNNIYIVDINNHRIRRVDYFTGVITTYAGNGTAGNGGDGGLASSAQLNQPNAIIFDLSGNLYVADAGNNVIRKISTGGIITTIAGNGTPGYSGDGGNATTAQLKYPTGVCIDTEGNLIIGDNGNYTVRKVTKSGIITTIAGDGNYGSIGDGGAAISAEFKWISGVYVDKEDNIFVSDAIDNRIRKINKSSIISTVVGTGVGGYNGDGGLADTSKLNIPSNIFVDSSDNLYIPDYGNRRIRKVSKYGIITTIVGCGIGGFSGDGGTATSAKIGGVQGITIDSKGNLLIADANNNRIRKVTFNVGVNNIENPQNNISIYPNPATNQINITATTKIESIIITNTIGQVVFNRSYTHTQKAQIDISHLEAGIYFIKIISSPMGGGQEGAAFVQKFVKE